jgi:hypothetical protein
MYTVALNIQMRPYTRLTRMCPLFPRRSINTYFLLETVPGNNHKKLMWSCTLPSACKTPHSTFLASLLLALIYACSSQQYTQSKLVITGQPHSFEISLSVVEGDHHLFTGMCFSVTFSSQFVANS